MKKRLIIAFIVVASVLLFLGASPWEGSAAIAPNGELPATGYYIATNAYPRNTVVDITNLETGKSTRVIVSNTLSNPGLLAVVSRQAGELIGMRTGSVSRLRMIQPTDPMAYMRFTQSMKDGNPEFDSGNVITEDNLAENKPAGNKPVENIYKDDTYEKPEVVKAPEEPKSPLLPGYIVDEPEWGGSGRLDIVDLPDYMSESEKVAEVPKEVTGEPEYDNTQRDIAKDVAPKIGERPPVEVAKDLPEYNPDRSFEGTETPLKEVVKDVPVFITEAPRDEVVKDVSPWQERTEVATPVTPPPMQLVPVETSPNPPPSNVYGIDPNDIIPGIVVATPEKPAAAVNTAPNTPVTPAPDRNLSVNTIDRLDRGKYYVQVAAMSADLVEGALRQIDRGYAPVVFKGTDNLYRILIGPLNQGESAAVLSRFRSIGYKDAFVRKGG
jgi:cell division septation protein DedD